MRCPDDCRLGGVRLDRKPDVSPSRVIHSLPVPTVATHVTWLPAAPLTTRKPVTGLTVEERCFHALFCGRVRSSGEAS